MSASNPVDHSLGRGALGVDQWSPIDLGQQRRCNFPNLISYFEGLCIGQRENDVDAGEGLKMAGGGGTGTSSPGLSPEKKRQKAGVKSGGEEDGLGAWVRHREGVPEKGSISKAIPRRGLEEAKEELYRRAPIELAKQRAHYQAELDAIDDGMELWRRMIERTHGHQPDDMRQNCAEWDDEATDGIAAVYVAEFVSGRTKIGEGEDVQYRTNQQLKDMVKRLLFIRRDEILSKGLVLQKELDEVLDLGLPMLSGCWKTNAKTKSKALLQLAEGITTAQFKLDLGENSPILESLLLFPTKELRQVADALAMLKYLEELDDREKILDWLAGIKSVFELGTWATLKSILPELYPEMHYLHNAGTHEDCFVRLHLSKSIVDEGKFDGMKDVCADVPYVKKYESELQHVEKLVDRFAARSDTQTAINKFAPKVWETLSRLGEKDYIHPEDDAHAAEAKQMIEDLMGSEPPPPRTQMFCIRSTTMDCLRKYCREWYEEMFEESIELDGPSIDLRDGRSVSSSMTLYKTRTGRIFLEHGAEFVAFAPYQSNSPDEQVRESTSNLIRFNALRGLMNKAALLAAAGVLSAEGLLNIQQRVLTACLAISGLNGSLNHPVGSWMTAAKLTLPDGLVIFGRVKGHGALRAAFTNEAAGAKVPYHAILLLLGRLGERFNHLLELLGSEYRMHLVKGKWCLKMPVGDGVVKYYYPQYNNITQEMWKKHAKKWLVAGANEQGLAPMLDASFNGKAPTAKTNNPLAANRERLDWIVNEIREQCPAEQAEILCKKLERAAASSVDGIEKKWWANFNALASFIEREYPGGLDSSKAFMPHEEDIGNGLRTWYLQQLGCYHTRGALTGYKRCEMEGLGITFDTDLIEKALNERSAALKQKSIDKNVAKLLAQQKAKKAGKN